MDESKFEEIMDMFNGLEVVAKNDPKLEDEVKNTILQTLECLKPIKNYAELRNKLTAIVAIVMALETAIEIVFNAQDDSSDDPLEGVTVKGGNE